MVIHPITKFQFFVNTYIFGHLFVINSGNSFGHFHVHSKRSTIFLYFGHSRISPERFCRDHLVESVIFHFVSSVGFRARQIELGFVSGVNMMPGKRRECYIAIHVAAFKTFCNGSLDFPTRSSFPELFFTKYSVITCDST